MGYYKFYYTMSFNLINHINQPIKLRMLRQNVGTQSVHFRYNDSGILCQNWSLGGKQRKGKSLNTVCIKAFKCGADETRTRDLLRDRQAF